MENHAGVNDLQYCPIKYRLSYQNNFTGMGASFQQPVCFGSLRERKGFEYHRPELF